VDVVYMLIVPTHLEVSTVRASKVSTETDSTARVKSFVFLICHDIYRRFAVTAACFQ